VKVINEIANYLLFRSALSAEDSHALMRDGWLIPDFCYVNSDGSLLDLGRFYDDDDWERDVGDVENAYDCGQPSSLHRLQSTGRKATPTKRRVLSQPPATAAMLDAWLSARLPAWQEQLAPLGRVITGRELRTISDEMLAGRVRMVVDRRLISWPELWHALAQDGFRAWFAEPGAVGPATQAFRAMLESGDLSASSKYRWILRHGVVANVCETAHVQRALLRAGAYLLEHAPDWVAQRVRQSKDRLSLFVLAIADAARRFNPTVPALAAGEEGQLPRMPAGASPILPLPPPDQRLSAVMAATLMSPRHALPFLRYCPPTWTPSNMVKIKGYSALQLRCPLPWNPKRLTEAKPDE
jgi:hypothetical protein